MTFISLFIFSIFMSILFFVLFRFGMDMDHQSSVNEAYVVQEVINFCFITLRKKSEIRG